MPSSHDRGWLSNTNFNAIVAVLVATLPVAGGILAIALTATPMKKMLVLNSGAVCVAIVLLAAYIIVYRSWASHDDQDALSAAAVPAPTATSTTTASNAAQPVESGATGRDHPFGSVTPGTPPAGLSRDQRDIVNMFARTRGPHTLLVVAGDSTRAIAYANSLADAFESGGWSVEGRAHDSARTVTHRMGAQLPSEPDVAVSPDNELGNAVKALLERIGLHPGEWVSSLTTASSDIRIWVGRDPGEQ